MSHDIQTALEQIGARLKSARWAALVGMDGLIIATVPFGDASLELRELLTTEYSSFLKQIWVKNQDLDLGSPNEQVFLSEHAALLLLLVDDDCFLILNMDRNGPVGKARHVLRLTADRLRQNI